MPDGYAFTSSRVRGCRRGMKPAGTRQSRMKRRAVALGWPDTYVPWYSKNKARIISKGQATVDQFLSRFLTFEGLICANRTGDGFTWKILHHPQLYGLFTSAAYLWDYTVYSYHERRCAHPSGVLPAPWSSDWLEIQRTVANSPSKHGIGNKRWIPRWVDNGNDSFQST
jgi:hypothetical protein